MRFDVWEAPENLRDLSAAKIDSKRVRSSDLGKVIDDLGRVVLCARPLGDGQPAAIDPDDHAG